MPTPVTDPDDIDEFAAVRDAAVARADDVAGQLAAMLHPTDEVEYTVVPALDHVGAPRGQIRFQGALGQAPPAYAAVRVGPFDQFEHLKPWCERQMQVGTILGGAIPDNPWNVYS